MKHLFGLVAALCLSTAAFAQTVPCQASPSNQVSQIVSYFNDPTTGTALNSMADWTSGGNIVTSSTSNLAGAIGVVVANAGTSGSACVAISGIVPLLMDNASTVGHCVIRSATNAGYGHDTGSPCTQPPTAGEFWGVVQISAGSGGIAAVWLKPSYLNYYGGTISVGASPITETWTVGTGGVTANTVVIPDASNPSKIVAATGTTAYGIAMSTVSASGTVEIARFGTATLVADNAVTAGDLIIPGTSTVVDGKDSGQTTSSAIAQNLRVIGRARTSATSGSTFQIDLYPDHYGTMVTTPFLIPAANCAGSTPASGLSLPGSSAPTITCRTGTNVQAGSLVFAASQNAQFQLELPADLSAAVLPYIRINYTQTGTTSGQTIAFQIQVACSSSTDDPSFATAQSFSTTSTGSTANTPYSQTLQLNSTSMSGCVGGNVANFKISTTSGSNGSPALQSVTVSIPRTNAAQAN